MSETPLWLFSTPEGGMLQDSIEMPTFPGQQGQHHQLAFGETVYTNPYGNLSVVDTAPENMLSLIDSHWYSFPPLDRTWYLLIASFLIVTAVIAVSGNLVVIYLFSTNKSLRSPSNYFVVNLAVSDLLLISLMSPPTVLNAYYETWIFGPVACQAYGVVGSMTGGVSIFTMCLISSDRYQVIVKGLAAEPLTSKRALGHLALVWAVSAVWTFTPLLGWGRYVPEGNMTACGTDYLSTDAWSQSYIIAYSIWVWLLPLVIIVCFYYFIVAVVVQHEKQMKEQAKKMGVQSLRRDEFNKKKSTEIKLAKVALMTVSLWFIAWTPYLIVNIAGLIKRDIVTPLFSIWGSVFAKASTVYNPIIYAISHPKYRDVLRVHLPRIGSRSSDPPTEDHRSANTAFTMA